MDDKRKLELALNLIRSAGPMVERILSGGCGAGNITDELYDEAEAWNLEKGRVLEELREMEPGVGSTLVDDNFGVWDVRDEDDVEFYKEVSRRSVEKVCSMCGRTVRIMPQYDKCNSCADALEGGWAP